jgi:hypothetical protein
MDANSAEIRSRSSVHFGRVSLWAFLFFSLLSISQPILADQFGALGERTGVIALLCYPFCLALGLLGYELAGPKAVPVWGGYTKVVVCCLALLGAEAMMLGNPTRVIILDGIGYVVFLLAFILGRRDEVWRDLRWPILILTALALSVAFVFTDSRILTDLSLLTEQPGYRIQAAFAALPLWALVAACERNKRYHYLVTLTLMGVLGLQLMFAKRAPSVRIGMVLVFSSLVFPVMYRQWKRVIVTCSAALICLVGILAFVPIENLLLRFSGQYGIMSTLTTENLRLTEARVFIDDMKLYEWATGRGLGGSVTSLDILDFSQDRLSEDREGRLYLHIGLLVPILKGGIPWLVILLLPMLLLVRRIGHFRSFDHLSQCGTVAGGIWLLFQVTESSMSYTCVLDALALGMAAGRYQNIRDRLLRERHGAHARRQSGAVPLSPKPLRPRGDAIPASAQRR